MIPSHRTLSLAGVLGWLVVMSGPLGCVSRAEKDVVVYATLEEEFAFPILQAFERSVEGEISVTPKFDTESTPSNGLVDQIVAEKGSPRGDLFWNNEIMHTVRLQKLGLLKPRSWKLDAAHPPDMIASDGTWVGFAARGRILLVNTDRITDPGEYPRSVHDLADPRWQNQCAMARPSSGTTATHFAVLRQQLGDEATLRMLEAIVENAMILPGNKQVALAVASGKVAWGLTDTDDAIVEKDHGMPVAIVYPDQAPNQMGTLRIPSSVAVIRGGPHPVAAGLLADYLLLPKTEERLAMGEGGRLLLHPSSKYRSRVLPDYPVRWMRADFEKAAEGWQGWAENLLERFGD